MNNVSIYKHDQLLFDNLHQMKMFCRIFSSIEQLECSINQPQRILFLLYRLSKLATMYVYLSSIPDRKHFHYFLKNAANTLKFMLSVKDLYANAAELSVWIDENLE